MLVVSMQLTSSTWWGFCYLQNNSRIWFKIFSIALEGELNVLDFVLWPTIIILSCLTVFLCHCIFSLFWLNLLFETRKRPRKLKLFYKQEEKPWGGGMSIPKRVLQGPTQFQYECLVPRLLSYLCCCCEMNCACLTQQQTCPLFCKTSHINGPISYTETFAFYLP